MPLNIRAFCPGNSEYTYVDFDVRLQHAGQTLRYFTNKGYTPQEGETELLSAILSELLESDMSGVEALRVDPFRITITHSTVVSSRDLGLRIAAIARRLGKVPSLAS